MPPSPEISPVPPHSLSIVIITRNEAKNIARSIESVILGIKNWPDAEILLVDSASTDETVEIAQRYPISIVRLDPSWFLSSTAGRYIGMLHTHGTLVLHMDGDMELDPGWVDRSTAYLLEHPDVGLVGGYYLNIYSKNGQVISEQPSHRDPLNRTQEVRYIGGVSTFRRSALDAIGGFQPYLRGEQDIYIGIRLRNAGYKVVQLPYLMSRHYSVPPHSMAYNVRRLKLDLWLGYGQVPRFFWGTPMLFTYLIERGAFLVYLTALGLTLITLLLSLITKNLTFFGVWLLIVMIFLAVFVIKKRSFRKVFISLIAHTGIAISAVRGFLMTPHYAYEYPTDVEIIQGRDRS
jgi:glycosyltransferase involved in cell wall biosynthesis